MHNDYIYRDRKMMKWVPFNALLEQGDHVSELLHGREKQSMPTLSQDQYQELNYQLEEAYLLQKEINLQYFDSHKYITLKGLITNVDIQNKIIFLNSTSIKAQQIINITY